jgi:hypothetical protein
MLRSPAGQIGGFELNGGPELVAVELLSGASPAGDDGRASRHALQAVGVKWATTREVVAGLAWHAEMAHLGVPQPMDDPALDHGSGADTGANSQVYKSIQPMGSAPAALGQRGAVDVGVEPHWHAQRPLGWADQVDVGPAWLRTGRDEPIPRMGSAQLQRAERSDADRGQRPAGSHFLLEERDYPGQRLG